jgi:C1A family cysteine protease
MVSPTDMVGSCWAFAAATTYSIRLYAMSSGAYNIILSPQDVTSCTNPQGCSGGWPICAFYHMSNGSTVCGFSQPIGGKPMPMVEDTCDPYTAKDHTTGETCGAHCAAPKEKQWQTNVASIAKVPPRNVTRMQEQIMTRGAISSCYDVYSDFTGRGVYIKTAGASLRGAHAVTTVGWGVDVDLKTGADVPYWLVQNSWVRPAPHVPCLASPSRAMPCRAVPCYSAGRLALISVSLHSRISA